MRRYAVMLAISLAFAGACKETLLLPSDKPDGGGGDASSGSGGRGSGGFFGTGGRPGGGGGAGMPPGCGGGQRKEVRFDIKRAQVLLAVGRNASMTMPLANSGSSRLSAVQQALQKLVADNDRAVDFAYEDFPAPYTCSNGTCGGTITASSDGIGKGSDTVWTCDLTKEYVAINGDYRS